MVFLAFFLIIIGIVATIFPYAGWYLSIGWKFRDAEPSDLALVMHRISGIVASVIGIIIIISSFSNFINQNSWEDRFKEKLVIDNVEFVSIGIGESPLFADEEKEILSLIREAEISNRKDQS